MDKAPYELNINSVGYPCTGFETVQQGEKLEEVWDAGLLGGMGEFRRKHTDRYYYVTGNDGADTTTYPYIRLRPAWTATFTFSNFSSNPMYAFRAQDGSGNAYVYLLSGRYSQKIRLSNNTIGEAKDHGATAIAGRPALFEGNWRLALANGSGSATSQSLTTIATPPATDTYTAITGITARHFATLHDISTANLVRAHTTNLIDLSSDAVTFGADFEIGDSSLGICDLLSGNEEITIMKPDGPWRFTALGEVYPLQEFVGRNPNSGAHDGANSHNHGPLIYWPHSSSLWRIVGRQMIPVGFDSDPSWLSFAVGGAGIATASITSSQWSSVAAWGRWLYATYEKALYCGYILEDGTLLWHGHIFRDSNRNLRCQITEGPILWVVAMDSIDAAGYRMNLHPDGSMHSQIADTAGAGRGNASYSGQVALSFTDFGRSGVNKQARRTFVVTEDLSATASVAMGVSRDRSTTTENVGAAITTNGIIERAWTAGSSDTFGEIMPVVQLATTAGYTAASRDPRVRAVGIEAVTSSIYKYTIPLVPGELGGKSYNVKDGLGLLRDLKNGQSYSVFFDAASDPEQNTSYTGYVVGLEEKRVKDGYMLELYVERWAF